MPLILILVHMMTTNLWFGFLTAIFVLIWRVPMIRDFARFPRRTREEDMSLLQLAEAFARKVERERALISKRINDPETIRDLLAIESVISPAHQAFLKMLNPIRPAHRLPREILMQIFALVGSGKRILPVSHVCRRWRDVTLKTPELWSTFEPDDITPMLSVALQRSGDRLLDVTLHASCDEVRRLERLLELPFSRLRSLDVAVTGPFTDEVKGIFSRCRSHASILNEFSLRFDFDASIPQPVPFRRGQLLFHAF
ncbi:hypothetical protein F5148DRAFT_426168 [Russula earlei]|uniref:Uncharacterized protein n=1 Tax=Russula earlei TaxID=71964 RepID=A0ACC0U0T4_9AGAM|nr:hypothetical protein F5148DRAFT_426168 [Russula earlei]